jgi:hypothetical protein
MIRLQFFKLESILLFRLFLIYNNIKSKNVLKSSINITYYSSKIKSN